jgi:hypothetical protein
MAPIPSVDGRIADPCPALVKTPQSCKCRYCKAVFDFDPLHPNKQFCKEAHQKLFWRYGSLSIGKLAERMQRQNQKLIAAEMQAMRAEMDVLTEAMQGVGKVIISLSERLQTLEAREAEAAA